MASHSAEQRGVHRWRSLGRKPLIEFRVHEAFDGVLPQVKPAVHHLPPEYLNTMRSMPTDEGVKRSTVRACSPYFDAMTAGFIIPMPVDVRVIVDEDGVRYFYAHNGVAADGQSDANPVWVSHHHREQTSPALGGRVVLKFISPYYVKTRKGYGSLFLPALNRDLPYRAVSGLVNTSTYHSRINIVVTWEAGAGDYELKQGTPLAQVVPVPLGELRYLSGAMSAEQAREWDKAGNACTLAAGRYKATYRERVKWTHY